MDIRVSDGDRIGRQPPRKSGKSEPATRAGKDGRIEPRLDGRGGGPPGDGRDPRKSPQQKPKKGKVKAAKPKKKRRSVLSRLFTGMFYWTLVLGFWAVIAVGGVVVYYGAQLPSSNTWAVPERPANIKILAADGQLISNRGKSGGEAISLHELPYYVPAAVIAIEDRRFMSHFGIDPIGLAAAMLDNLTTHRIARGEVWARCFFRNRQRL